MDRTKRVKILKKVIIGTVVTLIVLPTILSIVLFFKISELNSTIKTVIDQNIEYEESIRVLKTQLLDQQIESDDLKSRLSEIEEVQQDVETLDEVISETSEPEVWPKKVYLTFDDGPSGHTRDILDILDEYGVKGNFFVCHTPNEDYQKLYKVILDNGHMLGIHSYSHKYDEIYSSEEAFEKDVNAIRDFVYDNTDGYIAKYYRFPGGSSNLNSRISISACIDFLGEQGLTYFDWNISSQDATNPMQEADTIFYNATYGAEDYEEVAILMHDLGNKDTTVEALPRIIEYYQQMGAEISVINEDSQLIQHYNE